MRMRTVFCSVLILASAVLAGIQPVANVQPNVNPCTTLGNPPTVASCWSCFQTLLGDCDNAKTVERRTACYEGANTFFTWCLGRTTAPAGGPVAPTSPRPRPGTQNSMESGKGYSYVVMLDANTDPNDVVVFVRDVIDGKVRQQEAKSFVMPAEGNEVEIFFSDSELGVSKASSLGIITAIRTNGIVTTAHAMVVEVVHGLDLDGNGTVNKFDYIEACNRYGTGEMSFEVFEQYLSDFYASR